MIERAYYSDFVAKFLQQSDDLILGRLTRRHEFALDESQKWAWLEQIQVLRSCLSAYPEGYILFEYSIPRMGKRADVILLANATVTVMEFKVGADSYGTDAIDQVLDYALDLKNFQEGSHYAPVVPVLVATGAPAVPSELEFFEDQVAKPVRANLATLPEVIKQVQQLRIAGTLVAQQWVESRYKPTPSIVEAAQALYLGHKVEEISRSDAHGSNLKVTGDAISQIIDWSKTAVAKSICFVTGVPGAGKTLAGLNIANSRMNTAEEEHAVFLSGNGPLVKVLQEALARNAVELSRANGNRLPKIEALRKTRAFIQNIHHFRDAAIVDPDTAPIEKVAVFDEAQRAWDLKQTQSFMRRKKGNPNFQMSEPEFLISVMNRHQDWATIVCLIGGGQEINTGEAGILEWLIALDRHYTEWQVFLSDRIGDYEYLRGDRLEEYLDPTRITVVPELHLATSIRSFRSERVSAFVKALLDCDSSAARVHHEHFSSKYPIALTRDLSAARDWVQLKARGSERTGLIASSGAHRLRPYGIHVKANIEPEVWFLNGKDDVRSSYYLEEVATEFDIQGLELDWTIVAWGADLRFGSIDWTYHGFRGTRWQRIRDASRRLYLKNAYRVLLTRARQGMVIFVPPGDDADHTRLKSFYDGTYRYLRSIGLSEI